MALIIRNSNGYNSATVCPICKSPAHMEAFCTDPVVKQKFIECCLSRNTVLKNEEQHIETNVAENASRQPLIIPSDRPEDYEWHGLCLLLPRLVKHYFKTEDKNVWLNYKRPSWWPEDVTFKSPNHSRVSDDAH